MFTRTQSINLKKQIIAFLITFFGNNSNNLPNKHHCVPRPIRNHLWEIVYEVFILMGLVMSGMSEHDPFTRKTFFFCLRYSAHPVVTAWWDGGSPVCEVACEASLQGQRLINVRTYSIRGGEQLASALLPEKRKRSFSATRHDTGFKIRYTRIVLRNRSVKSSLLPTFQEWIPGGQLNCIEKSSGRFTVSRYLI